MVILSMIINIEMHGKHCMLPIFLRNPQANANEYNLCHTGNIFWCFSNTANAMTASLFFHS